MQLRSCLSLTLMTLLPFGTLVVVAAGCSSSNTSTAGQRIMCSTDPGTGEILRCAPGGDGSGANTCEDIDEDGDGEPHDVGDDDSGHSSATDDDSGGDRDHDGVSDDHDCDEHAGEDGDRDGLPYDVRPKLGASAPSFLRWMRSVAGRSLIAPAGIK